MMSPKELHFVSEMEKFGVATGLPPSIARVLGYLSVSEPAHQPASQVQAALELSSGSVSEALSILVTSRLVQRFKKPNDRRFYYELHADAWRRATIYKLKALSNAVTLAEKGMKDFPGNKRLEAMHEIYTLFDKEFSEIAKKLEL
jgi:DNA-binding transcriptional regulator GbsR (MarR family)